MPSTSEILADIRRTMPDRSGRRLSPVRPTDVRDAVVARDKALTAVEAGADSSWKAAAWKAMVGYLCSHAEFFVDDFWAESGLERPREARALGAVVQKAAREGLMERTGRSRPSVRSNMSDKPVWRSLIDGTDPSQYA